MKLERINASERGVSTMIIRKATEEDVSFVADIYNKIHALEQARKISIGWNPNVYPIRETAEKALGTDTLFVLTVDGNVIASAIINHEQPEAYSLVNWEYVASGDKVGVLHTLVVNPDFGGQGLGKLFVEFFENYCRKLGCDVVRLDTQVKNDRPFNMYPKLGYRLAGIRETRFQNLPETVSLAMFEKKL